MPVPSVIGDLSTTAGSNYPAGTDSPSTLDDVQRAHASFIAQLRDKTIDVETTAATSKATPVDADTLPIVDSAASNTLKKLTWANLKATLLTWLQGTVFPSPGAIGGTTPAAGSFTTLSATASGAAGSFIATTSNRRLTLATQGNNQYAESSTGSATTGSTAYATVIKSGLMYLYRSVNSALVGSFSSTGLAVTGALNASGLASLNSISVSGAAGIQTIDDGGSVLRLGRFSSGYPWSLISPNAAGGGIEIRTNPGATIAQFSSSGLAVTGALSATGTISPQQATTAGAPAYVKGALYFDTTLNKLRVGGATAWETVTSV